MKFLLATLVGALAVHAAPPIPRAPALSADELTITVTSATIGGKKVDPSSIGFEPQPLRPDFLHHSSGNRRRTTSYSANWCGATKAAPASSSSTKLRYVSSYFQVPTLTGRSGMAYPQYVAAWVGMDGATCNSALLQAGTTSILNSGGSKSHFAWFQWYPSGSQSLSNFPVDEGDFIFVNVTAVDATNAKILVENYSKSNSLTFNLGNGATLCQKDASYIVEDFSAAGGQVPFARFSDTWFQYTEAKQVGGTTMGVSAANLFYLTNGGSTPLCTATIYDNDNFYTTSS